MILDLKTTPTMVNEMSIVVEWLIVWLIAWLSVWLTYWLSFVDYLVINALLNLSLYSVEPGLASVLIQEYKPHTVQYRWVFTYRQGIGKGSIDFIGVRRSRNIQHIWWAVFHDKYFLDKALFYPNRLLRSQLRTFLVALKIWICYEHRRSARKKKTFYLWSFGSALFKAEPNAIFFIGITYLGVDS